MTYLNDGQGRDAYISSINGGFFPRKQATKIHEVGKRLFNMQAPSRKNNAPNSIWHTYTQHQ